MTRSREPWIRRNAFGSVEAPFHFDTATHIAPRNPGSDVLNICIKSLGSRAAAAFSILSGNAWANGASWRNKMGISDEETALPTKISPLAEVRAASSHATIPPREEPISQVPESIEASTMTRSAKSSIDCSPRQTGQRTTVQCGKEVHGEGYIRSSAPMPGRRTNLSAVVTSRSGD